MNGNALSIGSTFTQSDIDNGGLAYAHNADGGSLDGFRFHVEDGIGGWAGTPEFTITIDEDDNPFDLEDGSKSTPWRIILLEKDLNFIIREIARLLDINMG